MTSPQVDSPEAPVAAATPAKRRGRPPGRINYNQRIKQDVFDTICSQLALGRSVNDIAKQIHVSNRLVATVRDGFADQLTRDKGTYGKTLLRWSASAFQEAVSKLPDATCQQAAVVGGILTDKALVLQGLPSVIHAEVKSAGPPQERLKKLWERLAPKVVEVSVVEPEQIAKV